MKGQCQGTGSRPSELLPGCTRGRCPFCLEPISVRPRTGTLVMHKQPKSRATERLRLFVSPRKQYS